MTFTAIDRRDRGRWYLTVRIIDANKTFPQHPDRYQLGPIDTWSRANRLARAWEREHGPNTVDVSWQATDDRRYKAHRCR